MAGRKKRRQLSIRNAIIVLFLILMLTTSTVIGYIIFSNWLYSADKTANKFAQDLNYKVYHEIDGFISSAMHVNDVNSRLIKNGIVDINDEEERDKFFVGVLQSHNSKIYSFSLGTENAEYYGARRNEKGIIEIMHNNSQTAGHSWYYSVNEDLTAGELTQALGKFDPRTRDWYKAAKESRAPVFSPIYKHFVMDDLTVSAAYPIFNEDGSLMGVLGTHTILSDIDDFLYATVKDFDGYAVIFESESKELVANSFGAANFDILEDGGIKRFGIEDTKNAAIIKAFDSHNSNTASSFRIPGENGNLTINIVDYRNNGLNWTLMTAVPESLLTMEIVQSILLTVYLVIAAVMLSVAVYFLLTNKLLKPVKALMDVTDKICEGDFSQRASVLRDDEIGRIANGVNKMADKLVGLVSNLEETVRERTAHLTQLNTALEENKEKLQLILDSTAEAIYGIDVDGICIFCNASCLRILGYRHQDELIGKNMHFQIHHSYKDKRPMPAAECKIIKALTEGSGVHVNDEVFWRADGTSFEVDYYSYPQYKNNVVAGAVVTFMDNTERKKAEEQIKYLSSHDSLTGLYNRMYFQEELVKIDCKENFPISIIFADVNGLKLTNDIFGHFAGDKLIIKAAQILKDACGKRGITARVGGDEFVLLLPRTEKEEADRIIESIRNDFAEEKIMAIQCSISLGVSTKSSESQRIERVMENAENAMYSEKTLARKSVDTKLINTIISTLHENNPSEKSHSKAVSQLCRKIGIALKLPAKELRKLEEAGFMHDIGKIALDKSIISKQDGLTQGEVYEIQQHSIVGYRILNMFDDTLDLAEAVYSHHERWDGSGYPKGLKGNEIPLTARIISIAESYDRIVTKLGKTDECKRKAIEMITDNAGTQFDPEIAKLFAKLK